VVIRKAPGGARPQQGGAIRRDPSPVRGERAPDVKVPSKSPATSHMATHLQHATEAGVSKFVQDARAQKAGAFLATPGAQALVPDALKNGSAARAVDTLAAHIDPKLREGLAALTSVYADGLVEESEVAALGKARTALGDVLRMRDHPALDMLDGTARAALEDHLFEPLTILDRAASSDLSSVLKGVSRRDREALRERITQVEQNGQPAGYRRLDVAALQAGTAGHSLAGLDRYGVGDLIAVPRSGGGSSLGVVTGLDDDGLRVEVLRQGQVGMKKLSAEQVEKQNPLKLGDYISAQGREVWITGTGPDGRLVGTERRGTDVRRMSADEVQRLADELKSQLPGAPTRTRPRPREVSLAELVKAHASQSAGGVGEAAAVGATGSSRQSLESMLDDVWQRRGELQGQGYGPIYKMYNAPTEANPLSQDAGLYLGDLSGIAKGRPADATSNLQGFGGSGDSISEAVQLAESGQLGPAMKKKARRTFFRFQRANWDPAAIKERVYVNANADKATELMRHLVQQVVDNPQRFPGVEMAKISGPDAVSGRAENIVLYTTSDEAAARVTQELARVQQRHPDWFKQSVPQMTEPVLPGVARGSEPDTDIPNQSFGSLRALVISGALTEAVAKNLDRETFGRIVDERLKLAGVNPEQPHRNMKRPGGGP
jgi:hypothetical protein